jgi:hypothetical protein
VFCTVHSYALELRASFPPMSARARNPVFHHHRRPVQHMLMEHSNPKTLGNFCPRQSIRGSRFQLGLISMERFAPNVSANSNLVWFSSVATCSKLLAPVLLFISTLVC